MRKQSLFSLIPLLQLLIELTCTEVVNMETEVLRLGLEFAFLKVEKVILCVKQNPNTVLGLGGGGGVVKPLCLILEK